MEYETAGVRQGERREGSRPHRGGVACVAVALVTISLALVAVPGAFGKGSVATDCPLSLKELTRKSIEGGRERFTVYRCEWVVTRFDPVHPKMGNQQVRWGEPWCRPIIHKVLDRGLSWPEAAPEDIACMGKLMEAAYPE